MTPQLIRIALLAAINAAFDVIENVHRGHSAPAVASKPTRRRAPVRPPVAPSQPPSELEREAARQELRRMGLKVPR